MIATISIGAGHEVGMELSVSQSLEILVVSDDKKRVLLRAEHRRAKVCSK